MPNILTKFGIFLNGDEKPVESKIHPIEHSFFEIRRLISGLITRYPFLGLKTVGRSVAGREILALTVGSGGSESVILSGADPSFRLGTLILLRFVEDLCDAIVSGRELSGISVRKAMFQRTITVIPTLNPDGAEVAQRGEVACGYMTGKISDMSDGDYQNWRANLRGVELSRNFEYNFEKSKDLPDAAEQPYQQGFRGYRAQSEPETAALKEFLSGRPVGNFLELSATGNLLYYGTAEQIPPHSEKIAEVLSIVSGLEISPPLSNMAPTVADWFVSAFHHPAFCVKAGQNGPPPVAELDLWYARLKEMLILFTLF